MYNEKLKTEFVRYYTSSINTAKVCNTVFDAFEPYEQKWEADLCTKSTEELQPIVDTLVGFRARSKWMRLIILKDYVKWCMASNVPGACDGMTHINATGLDKVKHQTVSSPAHLQRYLDILFEPENDETIDNIFRCFYWLAYLGIPEEDIFTIKCSDVDLGNRVVYYKNEEIDIYKEAFKAFKNCATLTQFLYINPSYPSNNAFYRDRAPGDTLIRGFRSITLMSMRAMLSRRSKEKIDEKSTDLKLSYYRVWISGLFYKMYYERENSGMSVDFSDAAERFMEGKIYKLDSGRNKPSAKKRQIAYDYLEDYQRWKLAHYK